VFENFRVGIERTAAAHNHAQIIPGQPVFQPQSPVTGRARPQLDGRRIHRARTGHHRVRRGAQLEQMLAVARTAAERNPGVWSVFSR